ncbi:MAG: GAF domain-containing protein, partial [Cyanobacteria bacterium P01_A01_bin.135]
MSVSQSYMLPSVDSSPFKLQSLIVRDLLTVSPGATVAEAIAQMQRPDLAGDGQDGQIRSACALVVEDQRCVGLLSAQTVLQLIAQGDCLDEVTVGQAVADTVEGLQESDLDELSGLSTVLNHLRTFKEAYIPVLSDQGAPVGVVSRDAVETAIQVVTSLDHQAATAPQPQPSIDREHLLSAVADQVRSSLETQHVLNYAVEGVRSLLDCSRVIVYQLRPDFSGTVVAEALDAGHRSVLHQEVQDPCVSPEWIEPYRSGKIRAINDVYDAAISLCHQEMLTGFDIRAKLMAPIVIQGELWGLIVASHRDRPHVWTPRDVLLLRQLSTQVAIALHQAITHQQLQRELQT